MGKGKMVTTKKTQPHPKPNENKQKPTKPKSFTERREGTREMSLTSRIGDSGSKVPSVGGAAEEAVCIQEGDQRRQTTSQGRM